MGLLILLKLAQGHNGPALTLNIIPEPDRNRVNAQGFRKTKNENPPKREIEVTS